MYLLYLDESGNSSLEWKKIRETSDFFVLGGILVKESDYDICISKFREFKIINFPESLVNVPIHAVALNQISKNKNSPYKNILSDAEGKELLKKTYNFMSTLPIETIATIIDNYNLKNQYTKPQNPYDLAYMYVLERFQGIISGRKDSQNRFGIVNLAEASTKTQKNLVHSHQEFIDKGTRFVKKFDCVFRKLNIEPSKNSTFFEFADLACYAYQRAYYSWLCKNLNRQSQDEGYLKIVENICTLNIGRIKMNGIRIKVFPYPRFLKKKE